MPRKSTAAYQGPPSWLDASAERSVERSPTRYATRAEFIAAAMRALLALGLSVTQAANVTANAINESGWGRSVVWGNAGGWKITRGYVAAWRARHGGACPPWWKARGNVDSADSDWCFYRCFEGLDAFLREWCEHFIPRPGEAAPYPGYRTAGARFWAGDARWFGELILVGYKGAPSQIRMRALRVLGADDARHPSVRDHRSIVRSVLTIWAQLRLGLDPDGAWGPKSRAACSAWQRAHGLAVTGEPDDATIAALEAPAQADDARTHAVAEDLRAHGAVVTDAEVDAQLGEAAKALGG